MQSHINVRKEPTQRISFYMTNFGKFLLLFFPFFFGSDLPTELHRRVYALKNSIQADFDTFMRSEDYG